MSTFRIISGSQSKEADRYAIDTLQIPSLTLMENASRFVANEAARRAEKDARILLCCGVGNNGADALCAGRFLAEDGYTNLHAVVCGDEAKATWEFQHQLEEFKKAGLPVTQFAPDTELSTLLGVPDVVVDGVFGIGLHRPVEGDFLQLLLQMEELAGSKIAIDIPSGVDSDTGQIMGAAVHADVTITFGCSKTGIILPPGSGYAGRIRIVDIDIPEEAYIHAIGGLPDESEEGPEESAEEA